MSVHLREWTDKAGRKRKAYRVRWQEGERWRSRTFKRRQDADDFDAEVTRRRRLGTLAELDAGTETLDQYVTDVWTPTYAPPSPKTRKLYAGLYDHHISPQLGSTPLRQISSESIRRWMSDRLAAGGGEVAVDKAFTLLGNLLQRAYEGQRITSNPARAVRRPKRRKRAEVRPFPVPIVEAMRAVSEPRDATLLSVLAYGGLRPGEALALCWGDVRDKTIMVERAASLGEEGATKTGKHRTVRLLAPLARDIAEWRMRSGRPDDSVLLFPGPGGRLWTETDYDNWRDRQFRRALSEARGGVLEDPLSQTCPKCKAASGRVCRTPSGREASRTHSSRERVKVDGRPYDLRHTFASLLLHEGRSVIYVARQLGHDARLTLTTYGHVMDELEDLPGIEAETVIEAARSESAAHELPKVGEGSGSAG